MNYRRDQELKNEDEQSFLRIVFGMIMWALLIVILVIGIVLLVKVWHIDSRLKHVDVIEKVPTCPPTQPAPPCAPAPCEIKKNNSLVYMVVPWEVSEFGEMLVYNFNALPLCNNTVNINDKDDEHGSIGIGQAPIINGKRNILPIKKKKTRQFNDDNTLFARKNQSNKRVFAPSANEHDANENSVEQLKTDDNTVSGDKINEVDSEVKNVLQSNEIKTKKSHDDSSSEWGHNTNVCSSSQSTLIKKNTNQILTDLLSHVNSQITGENIHAGILVRELLKTEKQNICNTKASLKLSQIATHSSCLITRRETVDEGLLPSTQTPLTKEIFCEYLLGLQTLPNNIEMLIPKSNSEDLITHLLTVCGLQLNNVKGSDYFDNKSGIDNNYNNLNEILAKINTSDTTNHYITMVSSEFYKRHSSEYDEILVGGASCMTKSHELRSNVYAIFNDKDEEEFKAMRTVMRETLKELVGRSHVRGNNGDEHYAQHSTWIKIFNSINSHWFKAKTINCSK